MRVCTGFGPRGYAEYGVAALESFDRYWPKEVELVAYTESEIPMPRGECRDLWSIPGAKEFADRHKDNLPARGLAPIPQWGDKDRRRFETKGNAAWKWDAFKWFRQCMIPEHASLGMENGDVLCWLDGDVISFRQVPDQFVERLLGKYDIVYLGRARRRNIDPDHIGLDSSEIGFWAVRLSATTRAFLAAFANAYRQDKVFALHEWHSAYVFDVTRRQTASLMRMRMRDLTPGGSGHVWFRSELGHYLDHLKGDRKSAGRSPERRT